MLEGAAKMRHATTPAEYVARAECKARFQNLNERHAILHQVDDQRGYTYVFEHPGSYVGGLVSHPSGSFWWGDDPLDYQDMMDGYSVVDTLEVLGDGVYLVDGVRWDP